MACGRLTWGRVAPRPTGRPGVALAAGPDGRALHSRLAPAARRCGWPAWRCTRARPGRVRASGPGATVEQSPVSAFGSGRVLTSCGRDRNRAGLVARPSSRGGRGGRGAAGAAARRGAAGSRGEPGEPGEPERWARSGWRVWRAGAEPGWSGSGGETARRAGWHPPAASPVAHVVCASAYFFLPFFPFLSFFPFFAMSLTLLPWLVETCCPATPWLLYRNDDSGRSVATKANPSLTTVHRPYSGVMCLLWTSMWTITRHAQDLGVHRFKQ
jgi:hypothetical protein